MTKYFVYLFIIILFLTTSSCRKNPVGPPPPPANDTTSHAWTFTKTLLGDGASSVLYDVAIINDTMAISVGDVYQNNETQSYGVALWNGQQLNLRRLYAYTQEGYLQNIRPITGVFVFSTTDIWLADGNAYHWNGHDTILTPYWISGYPGNPHPVLGSNQGVNKFWGTSSNNLYGCGVNGGIAHYNGSNWTKIESGTTLSINDIYGSYNSVTSQWEILAIASNQFQNQGKKVLRIQGNSVTAVSDSGLSWAINGIWFVPNQQYYIVGDGIGHKRRMDDGTPWSVYPHGAINSYYSGGVSGQSANDVFVVGSFLEIVHYNGSTWHNYNDVIPYANGGLGRVALKGNVAIVVGYVDQQAIAMTGRR